MITPTADAPLLEHTDPTWSRPLPAALREARSDLPQIVADILAIPESTLERPWAFGGGQADVRYGIYRPHELFERAEIDASRAWRASGIDGGSAADLIAPTTAARWDLHGLLAPLSDADLDADVGAGEWTIRLTLGHIVASQRGYGWGTAWWQAQGFALDDPAMPPRLADEFWAALPDEETTEAAGSLDEIRERLDAITDFSTERLAGLPDDRMELGARWMGIAVSIGFRLGRQSSHIREHTIQIEKALAAIGRHPTEPERLVRLTLAAYGRAESAVFGQPDADDAAAIIRAATAEAREIVADARWTAGA